MHAGQSRSLKRQTSQWLQRLIRVCLTRWACACFGQLRFHVLRRAAVLSLCWAAHYVGLTVICLTSLCVISAYRHPVDLMQAAHPGRPPEAGAQASKHGQTPSHLQEGRLQQQQQVRRRLQAIIQASFEAAGPLQTIEQRRALMAQEAHPLMLSPASRVSSCGKCHVCDFGSAAGCPACFQACCGACDLLGLVLLCTTCSMPQRYKLGGGPGAHDACGGTWNAQALKLWASARDQSG